MAKTPAEFVELARSSSVGRDFLECLEDVAGKQHLLGDVKPEDVHRVGGESETFQKLLADLDERFVRAVEYLELYADFLSRDGNGWITRKKTKTQEPVALGKALERKKRAAPGSKDLGPVRAMQLGVVNPEFSFASFKFPESCLVSRGAQTDVINIGPGAPRENVVTLKRQVADDSEVVAREVASDLLVSVAHEMRHALTTYERIAGRMSKPREPSVPEAYYELYQEEQITREVALQVAKEIGYSLPRKAIDSARQMKDFRALPVGYTDVLSLWQRENVGGLTYAEIILLDVVLKPRFGTPRVVCGFDEAKAAESLQAAGLENGITLKGWESYRQEIAKIKKPAPFPKSQLDLYTLVHVKALLPRRFEEKLPEVDEPAQWNRAYDEELKLRADMVFKAFGMSYQKLYRAEDLSGFLPPPR